MLFVYYPFAFIPFWGLGLLFCDIFGAGAISLYFGLPFLIALVLSIFGAAMRRREKVKKLLDSMALNKFAIFTFATFVAAMIVSSAAVLCSQGWGYFPYVLGSWIIMVTIFPMYLFPYLFIVYLLFYKNNPEFA